MASADPSAESLLSPDEVRALRGDLSRAAFARRVGVTPLTVYRWELPDGAAEARRVRGPMIEVVRRAARGESVLPAAVIPAPSPTSVVFTSGAAPSSAASSFAALPAEEHELLLPAFHEIARAAFRPAEEQLLGLLSAGRLRSAAARQLATVGLACVQLLGRVDSRGAFTTLLPLLAEADAGALCTVVALQVHGVAALVFGCSDGQLFDPGKAAAHAQKVEALAAHTGGKEWGTAEARVFAALGELGAAFHLGDVALVRRLLERSDDVLQSVAEPLFRLLVDDMRANASVLQGAASLATRRFRELAQAASAQGFPLVEARALAFVAARRLEEAGEPAEALTLARRARDVAREARLGPGLHSLFIARAEGQSLLRLARFEEADRALREGLAAADSLAWSPAQVVLTRARLLTLTGRIDDLRAFAASLRGYDRPLQPALVHAYGLYAQALADFVEADSARAVAGFEACFEKTQESGGWPFLQREALAFAVGARVQDPDCDPADVRASLRRAERLLERYPSLWTSALLRRFEGMLLFREHRLAEARQRLESSLATFTLSGDLPEAALTRRCLAAIAYMRAEPSALEQLSASDGELRRIGVRIPPILTEEQLRLLRARPAAGRELSSPAGVDQLAVAVERLSVRGAGVNLLVRELLAVVGERFPGRGVWLEEIDSRGNASRIGRSGAGDEPAPAEWVEFGDGCGRRLRLGLSGELPPGARATLSTLAQVASLALEVAALRGFAEPPLRDTGRDQGDGPELAGFVAASPEMKRLRRELARLSASRSTVIVQGESGSGKEVVARAIHDLSVRAGQPYVAFNCAAVPRDLFEGQLFGYRRGAFTGAVADQPGVIRAADGGTLFLDEVGELPLDVQPKLLRFLENGEVFPLGERKPVHVDVRVLAATHRDLAQLVREGRFREDLFYRLQVVPLRVPPLRERREDVIALARHFVRQLTPPELEPPVLSPDALAALVAHPWPGNVRELRNVIERSLAFGPLPRIVTSDHLRLSA